MKMMINIMAIMLSGFRKLYMLPIVLTDRQDPYKYAHKSTRLVLDGLPRSGNSSLTDVIRKSFDRDELHIANHTHRLFNLSWSNQYNVPAVVVIREPISWLKSNVQYYSFYEDKSIRNGMSEFGYYLEYIVFISYVIKMKKNGKVHVVNVSDLWNGNEEVIESLASYIGSNCRKYVSEEALNDDLQRLYVEGDTSGQREHSVPNKKRKLVEAKVSKNGWLTNQLKKVATAKYNEVIN